MSEISSNQPDQKARADPLKAKRDSLAACYARVFLGTEDGRRVWDDLRSTFHLEGGVFTQHSKDASGRHDPISAALRDGARQAIIFIRDRLIAGAPGQLSTTQHQPQASCTIPTNPSKLKKPRRGTSG